MAHWVEVAEPCRQERGSRVPVAPPATTAVPFPHRPALTISDFSTFLPASSTPQARVERGPVRTGSLPARTRTADVDTTLRLSGDGRGRLHRLAHRNTAGRTGTRSPSPRQPLPPARSTTWPTSTAATSSTTATSPTHRRRRPCRLRRRHRLPPGCPRLRPAQHRPRPLDTHRACVTGTVHVLDAARRLGDEAGRLRRLQRRSTAAPSNAQAGVARPRSPLPLRRRQTGRRILLQSFAAAYDL